MRCQAFRSGVEKMPPLGRPLWSPCWCTTNIGVVQPGLWPPCQLALTPNIGVIQRGDHKGISDKVSDELSRAETTASLVVLMPWGRGAQRAGEALAGG